MQLTYSGSISDLNACLEHKQYEKIINEPSLFTTLFFLTIKQHNPVGCREYGIFFNIDADKIFYSLEPAVYNTLLKAVEIFRTILLLKYRPGRTSMVHISGSGEDVAEIIQKLIHPVVASLAYQLGSAKSKAYKEGSYLITWKSENAPPIKRVISVEQMEVKRISTPIYVRDIPTLSDKNDHAACFIQYTVETDVYVKLRLLFLQGAAALIRPIAHNDLPSSYLKKHFISPIIKSFVEERNRLNSQKLMYIACTNQLFNIVGGETNCLTRGAITIVDAFVRKVPIPPKTYTKGKGIVTSLVIHRTPFNEDGSHTVLVLSLDFENYQSTFSLFDRYSSESGLR